MGFCGYLRQSTSVDILLGPFIDDSDGKTAETGLTLDVELSKNGQALADSESGAPTHDGAGTVDGYYNCVLGTTDTGTLGILSVVAHAAGFLPVHQTYQVVTANWFDSMCSTDQLDVNVTNVAGTSQTANDNGADINAILTDTADMQPRVAAIEVDTSTTLDTLIKDIPTVAEFEARTLPSDDYVVVGDTIAEVTNVVNFAGTAASTQIQTDVQAVVETNNLDHLAKTPTGVGADGDLSNHVVDGTILSHIMTSGADTSDFQASTDSLEGIRNKVTDASPQIHTATAGAIIGGAGYGTIEANTYAATATDNGTDYTLAPGASGLDVELTFVIGVGRVPSSVSINAQYDADTPVGSKQIDVYAYNYTTAADEKISDSATDIENAASDQNYQYFLTQDHYQISDGEVKISFKSSTTTDTDDRLYLDMVVVNSVVQEAGGLTANAIQAAVWARADSGHDENTLGYNLAKMFLAKGTIDTVTSATQFTMSEGFAANDAYNGMLMMVEDKTDGHYEIRRIVDWIGATKEVFVDRAYGFTPAPEDDCYLVGNAYADVNTTHISGTAQTANDNGADINDILVDTARLYDSTGVADGDSPVAGSLAESIRWIRHFAKNEWRVEDAAPDTLKIYKDNNTDVSFEFTVYNSSNIDYRDPV